MTCDCQHADDDKFRRNNTFVRCLARAWQEIFLVRKEIVTRIWLFSVAVDYFVVGEVKFSYGRRRRRR